MNQGLRDKLWVLQCEIAFSDTILSDIEGYSVLLQVGTPFFENAYITHVLENKYSVTSPFKKVYSSKNKKKEQLYVFRKYIILFARV